MLLILAWWSVAAGQAMVARNPSIDTHVRSAQSDVIAMVGDGAARSVTFAALVTALNASDVVVYIQSMVLMPIGVDGYLAHHVTTAGDRRYLQIVVNARLQRHRDRFIAIIAHELQHANEVAQAATVTSNAAIHALFQSLDSHSCLSPDLLSRCVDTSAAVRVQEAVLRELRNSGTSRPAR